MPPHQSKIQSRGMTPYQEKGHLGKCRPARGVMVMCYGWYANGLQFDSLTNFPFFVCFFSGSFFLKLLRLKVSVVRLGLESGLRLGCRFIF